MVSLGNSLVPRHSYLNLLYSPHIWAATPALHQSILLPSSQSKINHQTEPLLIPIFFSWHPSWSRPLCASSYLGSTVPAPGEAYRATHTYFPPPPQTSFYDMDQSLPPLQFPHYWSLLIDLQTAFRISATKLLAPPLLHKQTSLKTKCLCTISTSLAATYSSTHCNQL